MLKIQFSLSSVGASVISLFMLLQCTGCGFLESLSETAGNVILIFVDRKLGHQEV